MSQIKNVWNRICIKRDFDAAAFDYTVFGFSLGVATTLLISSL